MSKLRKPGRPSKFTPATRRKILRCISRGVPLVHAAHVAGITFQTLLNHRRARPDFENELQEALSLAIESRLAVVERAMESEDQNIALRAATWWLTHAPGSAEYFSESRRLEVTGANGMPLAAAVAVYLPAKDGGGNGAPLVPVNDRKELTNGD